MIGLSSSIDLLVSQLQEGLSSLSVTAFTATRFRLSYQSPRSSENIYRWPELRKISQEPRAS